MHINKRENIATTLTDSLQLSHAPVAIAFTDTLPEGVIPYAGIAPAGCRFWQEATRSVFATVPRDHELCAIGVYTHHLQHPANVDTDLQEALDVFGALGYVRPEDIPAILCFSESRRSSFTGPWHRCPFRRKSFC